MKNGGSITADDMLLAATARLGQFDALRSFTNFYKNISIVAGLLLLALTGPGRYSVDRR